jgi:uncharacterized protein (DUF58 family)
MNPLPGQDRHASNKREVAQLAEKICLPFRSRAWRGGSGAWHGRSQGTSVDFQDHRAYMPGDDPRHIDWAAYARTNNYIMKLYREEVCPRLDLVLDASLSMALTPAKAERGLDLFSLVLLSALDDGIDLRSYAVYSTGQWRRLETRAALALKALPEFERAGHAGGELPLGEIPWRAGSLRILISDLLVPQPPEREMARLSHGDGRAVILAPYLQAETDPDWNGNLELRDCESRRMRQQRVEPWLLDRYRQNYRRHFELWRQEARRRGIPFARISCESSLREAVFRQALPEGVFELRH